MRFFSVLSSVWLRLEIYSFFVQIWNVICLVTNYSYATLSCLYDSWKSCPRKFFFNMRFRTHLWQNDKSIKQFHSEFQKNIMIVWAYFFLLVRQKKSIFFFCCLRRARKKKKLFVCWASIELFVCKGDAYAYNLKCKQKKKRSNICWRQIFKQSYDREWFSF